MTNYYTYVHIYAVQSHFVYNAAQLTYFVPVQAD